MVNNSTNNNKTEHAPSPTAMNRGKKTRHVMLEIQVLYVLKY